MGDLIQPIKDGKVLQTNSSTSNLTATSSKTPSPDNKLGKDAFLQLLVTQMKYQDPLNPSSNTEYVAQLATYSQLEQLQNISTASTNSQAFSLVGKDVVVKSENSTNGTSYVSGKVDFAYVTTTDTKLSINGKLYSFDQLDSVIDNDYVVKQGLPGISSAVSLKYDASNSKNLTFEVNTGSGNTVANDVAVSIGDVVINADMVKLTGNKVTINASAFSKLSNGNYKLSLAFNDSLKTTVKDKVTLQVQNAGINSTGA